MSWLAAPIFLINIGHDEVHAVVYDAERLGWKCHDAHHTPTQSTSLEFDSQQS
jgi:hypothetical protein